MSRSTATTGRRGAAQRSWRCAECGDGGRKRAPGAKAHAICLETAAFREDVLQLVERFPRAPLDLIATRLGGGITAADVERFIALARIRRHRIGAP